MTSPIEFIDGDPPRPSRGRPGLSRDGTLDALRDRPGEWAIIRRYPTSSTATTAASRLRRKYPGYEFAAPRRGGEGLLYARFAGGGES